MDLTERFSDVAVTGLDLSLEPTTNDATPSDPKFVRPDGLQLGNYESKFDIIYVRFLGHGLSHCPKTMQEVEACLKPGGSIIWMILDPALYQKWPPKPCDGTKSLEHMKFLNDTLHEG